MLTDATAATHTEASHRLLGGGRQKAKKGTRWLFPRRKGSSESEGDFTARAAATTPTTGCKSSLWGGLRCRSGLHAHAHHCIFACPHTPLPALQLCRCAAAAHLPLCRLGRRSAPSHRQLPPCCCRCAATTAARRQAASPLFSALAAAAAAAAAAADCSSSSPERAGLEWWTESESTPESYRGG